VRDIVCIYYSMNMSMSMSMSMSKVRVCVCTHVEPLDHSLESPLAQEGRHGRHTTRAPQHSDGKCLVQRRHCVCVSV
jgi:hypothetical protein